MVDGCLLTIYYTVGIHRQLHGQFIAAHNAEPPGSTNTFLHTVRVAEYIQVASCGIFVDEFHDKHPCVWTKQALNTSELAMEAYMAELIAASHC